MVRPHMTRFPGRRWAGGALCALALAGARPAAAQRADWSGYVDSVATRVDTAVLRTMLPLDARRASADALIAGGFAALRIHELSGRDRDVDLARDIFSRATSRFPGLAWAHYGHAMALAGSPKLSPLLHPIVTQQAIAEVIHADRASRARRALRRALELDSLFGRAAVELAREAGAARDHAGLVTARDALLRIRAAGRADAGMVLALSDAQRELGAVDSAAETAASPDAGSSAASDYARAAALLSDTAREAEGAKAWFAGVERMDSTLEKRYFEDIRFIATPLEIDRWRSGSLDERKALLRDFWTLRAAIAGVEVPERLGSHYRRLAVARDRYPREGRRGAVGTEAHTVAPSDSLPPFDDRGIIYLRHGEPDRVIRTPGEELQPNESWVYESGGRPRSFHFVKLRDAPGFRVVDNVLAAWSPSTDNFDPRPMLQYLEDRVAFDPDLAPLLTRVRAMKAAADAGRAQARATFQNQEAGARAGAGTTMADLSSTVEPVIQTLRQRTDVALHTDTDQPKFDSRVPFYYDLYTFKGAGGKTDLVATLAVPADRLTPAAGTENAYLLRLSLIVVDTLRRAVTRVDTTYALRTDRPLMPGDYIRVEAQLPAPPTNTAVERLVLRDQAGAAGEAYSSSVPLRTYAGELGISDIVLAEPRASGTWHRGGVSLALVPPREFPEGSFAVFYEVYNLPAGAPFETTIRVEGLDRSAISALLGRKGGAIRMSFRGDPPADPGTVQELRRIKGDLKPGRYRITIQVRELSTGRTATRDREFVVAKKKK